MNKIGVCEWSLPVNGPFSLDFAADVGFEGIQLGDLGESQMGYPMNNAFIRNGYLEASQRTGVILHSMHLYTMVRDGGHIYPTDSPLGQLATEGINYGVQACEAVGIPHQPRHSLLYGRRHGRSCKVNSATKKAWI